VAFVILSFHYAHDLAQGLGSGCVELWDAEPHADAVGHEARRAPNKDMRAHEEKDRRTASWAVRKRGTEVPPDLHPLVRGGGTEQGGYSASPGSPACGSFPMMGHRSPIDSLRSRITDRNTTKLRAGCLPIRPSSFLLCW
jgi:hypothetical protein